MGLFGKEKTSLDYLKSIADSQKQQANSQKQQAKAERRAAGFAAFGEAISSGMAMMMEAGCAEDESRKERKIALDNFYEQFKFDPLNAADIEMKCLDIIAWIDSARIVPQPKIESQDNSDNHIFDDNFSKAQTLKKILKNGIERMKVLNVDKSKLKYIEDKMNLYKAQEAAKIEAERIKNKKKKDLLKLAGLSTGAIILILVIISMIPKPKTDREICNVRILQAVSIGDLDKAKQYIIRYKNSKIWLDAEGLIQAYLNNNDLNNAEMISNMTRNSSIMMDYYINKGDYDKASNFVYEELSADKANFDYISKCVEHMCKKGDISRAKQFMKVESSQRLDSYYQDKYIPEFNKIIQAYAQ